MRSGHSRELTKAHEHVSVVDCKSCKRNADKYHEKRSGHDHREDVRHPAENSCQNGSDICKNRADSNSCRRLHVLISFLKIYCKKPCMALNTKSTITIPKRYIIGSDPNQTAMPCSNCRQKSSISLSIRDHTSNHTKNTV